MKNLRIVRVLNFYYVQKKVFGLWLYTDAKFKALSFRRAKAYTNPKTARAAFTWQVTRPFEVIEYLDQ